MSKLRRQFLFTDYRYLLACLLLTAGFIVLIVSDIASAGSELYKKYDYSSFSTSDHAQQDIILNNIDYELLNTAIHFETNFQRESNGLNILQHSSKLERSASEHAKAMAEFNFFSHSSPLPGLASFVDRLKQVGIKNVHAGENLAISFVIGREENLPDTPADHPDVYSGHQKNNVHTYMSLAKSVVAQWTNSHEHKENMLSSKYQFLGNGTALYYDKKGMPFIKVVQNFSSKIE